MSNAIAKFRKRKRKERAQLPWNANDVLRQVPYGKGSDYQDRPFPGGIGAQPSAETITVANAESDNTPMCAHGRRGGIGCQWCLGVNDMVDPEPIF